jgi:hypothetical protein
MAQCTLQPLGAAEILTQFPGYQNHNVVAGARDPSGKEVLLLLPKASNQMTISATVLQIDQHGNVRVTQHRSSCAILSFNDA